MFEKYPDIVSIDEVAEMLKIGYNKTYGLLREGKIAGFKEGRTWMIPKYAVENYVEENCNRRHNNDS